jgi:hypothetical protein
MADRSNIVAVSFRVAVAVVAVVGLVFLLIPGVARGLGRPSEVAPWTLTRPSEMSDAVRRNLLESDGLRVTGDQLSTNRVEWESLDEAQRKTLMEQYGRLQALTPAERKALVERYQKLSLKSDAERAQLRRQAAALKAFEDSLSRQDMAALESRAGKARAAEIIKLWRTSRGLE